MQSHLTVGNLTLEKSVSSNVYTQEEGEAQMINRWFRGLILGRGFVPEPSNFAV